MDFTQIMINAMPTFLFAAVVGILGMWGALIQIRQWQKNHDQLETMRAESYTRELCALRAEVASLREQIDGNKLLAKAISELAAAIQFLKRGDVGP